MAQFLNTRVNFKPKVWHWMDGWADGTDGWVDGRARLKIANSNPKY